MNGESEVLESAAIAAPATPHEKEVSEDKSDKIEEQKIEEHQTVKRESHLAKLRRSLPRRFAGIL